MLLCGYYGFGNLGDELLAQSLVDLLVQAGVARSEVALLSADVERSQDSLGVRAFDRWSLRGVTGALSRSETLLLGGGGLFQDVTSLRSPLYYGAVVALARLRGCLPWAFGQSVGPLRGRWGREMARLALKSCRCRVVRDEPSRELLQSWGLEASLSPDPVLALEVPPPSARGEALLVNFRPWGDLPREAAPAVTALAEEMGAPLVGLALADEDGRLMEALREEGRLPLVELLQLRSWADVAPALARGRAAVGMRLHFNVLSCLAGLPALAIPYDPKVRAFARSWQIPLWEGGRVLPPLGQPPEREKLEAARCQIADDLASAWRNIEEVSRL